MIQLLLTYKYIILMPLAIIEGPITSVVAGFLSTSGIFNLLLVFPIMVLGDMIGDSIFYGLGRWGSGILHRHGHRIGATQKRLDEARVYFGNNHHKALVLSKLIHGIGLSGLIVAGSLKVPYSRYIKTCTLIALGQSLIFLTLGVFFGHAFTIIGKYLNYYAAGASVLALFIIILIVFNKYKNRKNKI
jgi:membrane protein DedA with SNARE-associated domain